MLDWVGNDQPMKMRETSRAVDKKLLGKNNSKKKQYILDEYKPYFIYGSGDKRDEHTGKLMDIPGCIANGISETVATTIWNKMEAFGRYALTF